MAPLVNDPIMSERSIWMFRHLECQNLFIVSDSIGIPRWLQKNGKMREEEEQEQERESYSYRRGL